MAATASGKDKILKYTRFFIGGYDLSGDARNVGALTNTFGEVDMTGWSQSVRNYLADGRAEIGVTGFQAFMNDDTAGAFTRLAEAGAISDIAVLIGGGGEPAVPDPAFIMPSVQFMNTAPFDSEAAVVETDFKTTATADASFNNALGITLANTLFNATASNDSHDNEVATTKGGSACIQVLDATGDFVFTVEDSADDAAWATIGTFTLDGSTIGSEFITIDGTIRQYVRFTATNTSGSNNVICAYARNS